MKTVKITFQPIIWKDENFNNASQGIGSTTCLVSGKTEEQLFENIKHKIWAMSSEACIHNEEVARKMTEADNKRYAEIQEWLNSDSNTTWDEWQNLKNGNTNNDGG